MKQLLNSPTSVPLPDTTDLCANAPLFAGLSADQIARVAQLTVEKALAPEEVLFKQGTSGGNLFIVARGAVAVLREEDGETRLLDILGSGDVLGEMELLTGLPRTATVRALTTCLVGEIDRAGFESLMGEIPAVGDRILDAFARRRFDNFVRTLPEFSAMGHSKRSAWLDGSERRSLSDGDQLPTVPAVFVVTGCVRGGAEYRAPALVHPQHEERLIADGPTTVILLRTNKGGTSPDDVVRSRR